MKTAIATMSIGDRHYQTDEITTDCVKNTEQLSKLSDYDIENFKSDWESIYW